MKQKLVAVMLTLAMTAALAACGSKAEAPAEAPAETEAPAEAEAPEAEAPEAEEPAAGGADLASLKFGFAVGSFEHTFYQLIGEGIEAECKTQGLADSQFSVLDASLDPVIATQKVETLTADGCNAIALA